MSYGQQDQRQTNIYCGKAREMGGRYGTFYNLYLVLDDIPEEFTRTNAQGKRTVSLTMSELRQPDDRGNTHTLKVDQWKPADRGGQNTPQQGRRPQPQGASAAYGRSGQTTRPAAQDAPQGSYGSPAPTTGPESFIDDDIPF
jgi:hypothetical protein